MEGISIRKATSKDLGVLYEFEQGIIAAERPINPTLAPDPIHYYDLQQMVGSENIEVIVAVFNEKIIGSGYARIKAAEPYESHKNYAYLGFMYVTPEFRGKGINKLI